MPVYNSLGEILAGIGTAPVSISKVPIGTGGRGGWYNDKTAVYNRVDAGSWNVVLHYEENPPIIVLPGGANYCDGGGSVWAAWNNSGLYISSGAVIKQVFVPRLRKLRLKSGRSIVEAGPGTVGLDGAVGYCPDYQNGYGLDVREYSGETWRLTDGIVRDLQLLGIKRAIWRDEKLQVLVNNLPDITPAIVGAYRPRAVYVRNKWHLVYYTDSQGMVARPFDSNQGWVVGFGDKFYHDVRPVGNNIEMCFALHEGEYPEDIQTLVINLSSPTVPIGDSTVPIPPDPIPPDPEEEMKKPEITVDKWTLKNMNDGNEFIFHDRENPDLDYRVRVFIRNGSMYAEMSNREGLGSTGATRPVETCPDTPVPPDPNPIPPDPLPPSASGGIKLNGHYFCRQNGDRMTVIECSEFSLFKRYLDHDWPTYEPVLKQRRELGFNMLRVWLLNHSVVAYRNGVEQDAIDPRQYPDFYERLTTFVDELDSQGFCVELTVFTQTQTLMPNESDQQYHLNRTAKAVSGRTNVLLELVNENNMHDNAVSPNLVRPPGFIIISHGSNGADYTGVEPHWDYELYHTNGLSEWQRKTGHNAMEKSDHSGIPCISNENTRFPDNDDSNIHAFDAMAGAALLCAGACYHSQGGKFSRPFDPIELSCAKSWVEGALSVPVEFQPGQYARHDEMNNEEVIRAYSRTLPDGRSHLVKIHK